MNTLYYGDNLDVLRRYIPDESVDLVYLDPPFKSNQNYNVLFAERDGTQDTGRSRPELCVGSVDLAVGRGTVRRASPAAW